MSQCDRGPRIPSVMWGGGGGAVVFRQLATEIYDDPNTAVKDNQHNTPLPPHYPPIGLPTVAVPLLNFYF